MTEPEAETWWPFRAPEDWAAPAVDWKARHEQMKEPQPPRPCRLCGK